MSDSINDPATPVPVAAPVANADSASNDRTMALLAHLGGLVLSFIPALVIWLVKKDTSPFVAAQAKEALNFQITLFIALGVSAILIFAVVGCFLLPAVQICGIVFCIIAAVKAGKGENYRYPFALRLIP
jgi:uncharacterized protein